MNKSANYVATIKRLRLKRKISDLLPHFFNPSATVFLISIAFDDLFQQVVLVPSKSIDSADYISFVVKNNERSFNVRRIEYCFKEEVSDRLKIAFFLVEHPKTLLRFSTQNVFEVFNKNIATINIERTDVELDKCFSVFKENLETDIAALGCQMLLLKEIEVPVSTIKKAIDYSDDYIELRLSVKKALG